MFVADEVLAKHDEKYMPPEVAKSLKKGEAAYVPEGKGETGKAANAAEAPAMLQRLRDTVIANGNVFEVLMDAVRVCSLGQITSALFEVGGQYRRNM